MREVISVHVGQAGVQLGSNIWELYCIEHGLDPTGNATPLSGAGDDASYRTCSAMSTRRMFNQGDIRTESSTSFSSSQSSVSDCGSFFIESTYGSYTPRALFVDLEPAVVDNMKKGKFKNLLPSSRLITDAEDAANNFARGYYNCGKNIIDSVMNELKSMAESAEHLQGFMIYHSIGGGTGSGFHSLLTEEIERQFSKVCTLEVAIYPSPKLSTAVVEPYNAILATNATLDLVGCVTLSDNEAMYSVCQKSLQIDEPSYRDLNRLLAQAVSSVTASLRFKGSLNADFSDFQTNLVPFPRIHFPVLSYAPISTYRSCHHELLNTAEITHKVFEPISRLARLDANFGKYISCCLLYRGDVTPKDVNYAISQIKTKKEVQFVPWSPTGFKVGINQQAPLAFPDGHVAPTDKVVCMMANNTAIKESWSTLNLKYQLMLGKKAFFHWYTGEGMDENEFYDAQENVITLEEEYDNLSSNS